MDRRERITMYDAIPAGHAIVRNGYVRPDDLLFAWPAGGFLRADSPDWSAAVPLLRSDCNLVIRKAEFENARDYSSRTYTLRRIPRTPNPALRTATPIAALPDPQGSLF
jgi:hypothetical protein